MDGVVAQPQFKIVGVSDGRPHVYGSWLVASLWQANHDFYVLTATVAAAGVSRGTCNVGNAVVTYTGMMVIIEAASFGELLSAWNVVMSPGDGDRRVVFPDVRRGD